MNALHEDNKEVVQKRKIDGVEGIKAEDITEKKTLRLDESDLASNDLIKVNEMEKSSVVNDQATPISNIDEAKQKFVQCIATMSHLSGFKTFLNTKKGNGMFNVLYKNQIHHDISIILCGARGKAKQSFEDFYNLLFDEEGKKTKYLKSFEENGVNISNITDILNGTGIKAKQAFEDLYHLCFDEKGEKTKYLHILEDNGVNLSNISKILCGAGAKVKKSFENLFNVLLSGKGEKGKCLQNLEKSGINLSTLSNILHGSGNEAYQAFEDLYYLLFDEKDEKTRLLEDFVKAGFEMSNLLHSLGEAGTNASTVLKKLHNVCFDGDGNPTKYLNDFTKPEINFRPSDLCSILSQGVGSLEEFHAFCFDREGNPTKYLSDFTKVGFVPEYLSNVLHGAGSNICSALEDLHKVCFNDDGSKTECLNDFSDFTLLNLSCILSKSGANAASVLNSFHKLLFYEKKEYLNHFLSEKELFDLNKLSQNMLCGAGTNLCSIFQTLHDLCFDESGARTEYLNSLIEKYANDGMLDSNEIFNSLNEECKKFRKAPAASTSFQNQDMGDVIYQFKITLRDIYPKIWRRIQVLEKCNFEDLHLAIQSSMGWMDSHMHQFQAENPANGRNDCIGVRNQYAKVIPETKAKIVKYFVSPTDKASYMYDMGDGWRHKIVLEKILPAVADTTYPLCLAGKRACPPEDCGGSSGYENLLEILANPNHPEYEDRMEWLEDDFNPDDFDPKQRTQRMQIDSYFRW